jgi:hypothetical protein
MIRDLVTTVANAFYFVVTVRYFLNFRKNIIFTGRIKTLHLVLIWFIPFLWIFILKNFTKITPGSYEWKIKRLLFHFQIMTTTPTERRLWDSKIKLTIQSRI